MISSRQISSLLQGQYGQQGGIRFDYNFLIWSLIYLTGAFDLSHKSYVDTNTGSMGVPGLGWESCMLGTNPSGRQCFEASSLIVQNQWLNLAFDGAQISTSFTLQGWLFFKELDVSAPAASTLF
jgi:hypothetical protein